ncbi:GroES-like protein [Backusella circina FSU 941]|nr:GroES-like protein [Backusella circina FSU 941]
MTDIPETMHSIDIVKYGPAKEALAYNENRPVPKIKKPTQVLIKVVAAGINPVEAKARSGNMGLATGFILPIPSVLGADFSGVIAAKGTKVTEFEVGDEVFGSLHLPFGLEGTYAQYAIADTSKSSIAKKPANITHEEAASGGIAVITAYQGIVKNGNIDVNDTSVQRKILVVGASGGVGSYGVQFAKAVGAETVAICSGRNAEFVKSLGTDRVVDYTQNGSIDALVKEEAGTFDLVFDCVGGEAYYKQLTPLLKKKGVFSTAVGDVEHFGSNTVKITELLSIGANLAYRSMFGCNSYKMILHLPHSSFKEVAAFFESGKVRGTVKEVYSLKDTAAAHDQLMTHRTVGKIVLSIPQ